MQILGQFKDHVVKFLRDVFQALILRPYVLRHRQVCRSSDSCLPDSLAAYYTTTTSATIDSEEQLNTAVQVECK